MPKTLKNTVNEIILASRKNDKTKIVNLTVEILDDLIQEAVNAAKLSGEPGIFLVMERGGCFFYPLTIYERFEYPHMKKMVEAFAAEGLITVMHLDQDYTKNTPYFLESEYKGGILKQKNLIYYQYDNTKYPHAGAGVRVQF